MDVPFWSYDSVFTESSINLIWIRKFVLQFRLSIDINIWVCTPLSYSLNNIMISILLMKLKNLEIMYYYCRTLRELVFISGFGKSRKVILELCKWIIIHKRPHKCKCKFLRSNKSVLQLKKEPKKLKQNIYPKHS